MMLFIWNPDLYFLSLFFSFLKGYDMAEEQIDGLMQDCSNSSALAMELL